MGWEGVQRGWQVGQLVEQLGLLAVKVEVLQL